MAKKQINKIDHIGIVVNNIEDHIPYYRDILELNFQGIKTHEGQKIKTAIFQVGDSSTFLEVFQPTDDSSPVSKFLEKKGEGFHHFCFGVENIEEALDQVKNQNIQLINKEPFIGIKGKKVAFLHPKSTGKILTEFSE